MKLPFEMQTSYAFHQPKSLINMNCVLFAGVLLSMSISGYESSASRSEILYSMPEKREMRKVQEVKRIEKKTPTTAAEEIKTKIIDLESMKL